MSTVGLRRETTKSTRTVHGGAQSQELLDRYALWMRSCGWSPKTISQRLSRASRILERWPDPREVTTGDILDYLAASSELKPWTRTTYYNDTRPFFRWLTGVGVIPSDPMDSDMVRRPKPSQGVPKPLSRDEEARAVAAARGDNRAYLLLALRAGLRAHEIAKIRGEEVERDFIVLIGKGAKEASIPTHPDLWDLAQEYPRRGYWFPSPSKPGEHVLAATVGLAIGRLFRRPEVDIPTGSIHRCRHSYATNLLRTGADLRQVQQLMRHTNLNTTAIYTAVDEDDLRASVNRLGSREVRGSHLRLIASR